MCSLEVTTTALPADAEGEPPDDFEAMLERSRAAGVKSMIITGGSLHESREALELARQHGLYATVGCHPTRSGQFDEFKGGPDAYLEQLDKLIEENREGKGRVVAVGECGLGTPVKVFSCSILKCLSTDYDRTHFATPEIQQKYFRKSFKSQMDLGLTVL